MNDQNFSSYTEKNIKTNSDSLKETSFEVGQVSHIPSHSDFPVGHMVGLPDGLPVGQVSRDENKIDDESIRDVAESLINVHKAGLNLLRQIYPANLLKKASVLVKERNAEKYKQIKQWIFELDHLFIDDTVEIIETEDKGKRGTITTIKDSNGHSSGDRGIYNNCPKLGKEWSLTITFDDGSTETFYPDQVAKLD